MSVGAAEKEGAVFGLDVRTNAAIPDGVVCIVPSGSTLVDRRTRIVATTREALPAARALAFQLAALRDRKPGFRFSLPSYSETRHV